MATPIPYPLINGVRHSFASIELNVAGQIYTGFRSLNFGRTRSRGIVRGNHGDPMGKTRGENEYSGDCEMYLAEFNHLITTLGAGYGDAQFTVTATYSENGFDTVLVELHNCSIDSNEFSNSQGTDATVVKFNLGPTKILINGLDDFAVPLAPPPGL